MNANTECEAPVPSPSQLDTTPLGDVVDHAAPQFMLQRLPANTTHLINSADLLQSNALVAVDLSGNEIITYPGDTLISAHDLTEEDRNLAAALVAVQFNHHQQLKQQNVQQGSVLTSKILDDDQNQSLLLSNGLYIDKQAIVKFTGPQGATFSTDPGRFDESTEVIIAGATGDHQTVQLISADIAQRSASSSLERTITNVLPLSSVAARKSLPHKKRISRKLKKNPSVNASTTIVSGVSSVSSTSQEPKKCNDNSTPSNFMGPTTVCLQVNTDTKPNIMLPFSCQICSTSFKDQLSFFEHLKNHYEPKKEQSIQSKMVVTENAAEPVTSCSSETSVASVSDSKADIVVQFENEPLPSSNDWEKRECMLCQKHFRKQKTYITHMREQHNLIPPASETDLNLKESDTEEDGEDNSVERALKRDAHNLDHCEYTISNKALTSDMNGVTKVEDKVNVKQNIAIAAAASTMVPAVKANNQAVQKKSTDSIQMNIVNNECGLEANEDIVPVANTDCDSNGLSRLNGSIDEDGNYIEALHLPTAAVAAAPTDNDLDSKSWYQDDELHQTEEDLKDIDTHGHICQFCQQPFAVRAILLQHMVTCKQAVNANFRVLDGTMLDYAPKTMILPKRKYKKRVNLHCPQCDRVFLHRNSLMYHLRSHSGVRPHQCEQCGKSFFASGALKVHLRLHSGDRPYHCDECGKDFRQWGDLKYHITSLHSNERQFQCEYCGKDFARKYSLVVHRRIHTGERNYKCEYCSKTFRASSYLQNHRKIHTGEKPHECDICGKPFRVRSDMKRHLKTHHSRRLIDPLHPSRSVRFTRPQVQNIQQQAQIQHQHVIKTKIEPDSEHIDVDEVDITHQVVDDEPEEVEEVQGEILGTFEEHDGSIDEVTLRERGGTIYSNGSQLFLVSYATGTDGKTMDAATAAWIHS